MNVVRICHFGRVIVKMCRRVITRNQFDNLAILFSSCCNANRQNDGTITMILGVNHRNQSISQSFFGPHIGHGPPTWFRHAVRSWANLSNYLQMQPVSLTSGSRSMRHVGLFLNCPSSSLSFHLGILVKACRVMMWCRLAFGECEQSISSGCLRQISCSTGICHVRCHNRSLRIVSGHQNDTKDCSWIAVQKGMFPLRGGTEVIHVSAP